MIRLAMRVRRAQAELVLADLLELAGNGVEETELDGEMVEYAVYGSPGELPDLPELRVVAGEALVEVFSSEVADDWAERWKRFHRPVLLASPAPARVPSLHVRPPWAPASGHADACEIVIDPGQAFGTGSHATTRLCLELLLELAALRGTGGGLLDVGTGSGVLAIAASHLGYSPVLALDHDRLSVAAAIENAHVNDATLDVRRFDLRRDSLRDVVNASSLPSPPPPWLPSPPTATILANLLRPLLLDLVAAIDGPPRDLIASGLLCHEVDEVTQAFADRLGLREQERRESGDWAAAWLTAA